MGTTTLLTVDEFLALPERPDGQHYELSDGELVTVGNAKFLHEYVKARILEILILWNAQSQRGKVFSESTFKLAESTMRQPDVAFVFKERFTNAPDEMMAFAPNLAVEVISGSESAAEAEKKVQQFLRAGVDEVWQVYPESHVVHVRSTTGIRELHGGAALETPVLAGFSVLVSELFQ